MDRSPIYLGNIVYLGIDHRLLLALTNNTWSWNLAFW